MKFFEYSLSEVPDVDDVSSGREEGVGVRGEEEILNHSVPSWVAAAVRWAGGREGEREGRERREGGREGGSGEEVSE